MRPAFVVTLRADHVVSRDASFVARSLAGSAPPLPITPSDLEGQPLETEPRVSPPQHPRRPARRLLPCGSDDSTVDNHPRGDHWFSAGRRSAPATCALNIDAPMLPSRKQGAISTRQKGRSQSVQMSDPAERRQSPSLRSRRGACRFWRREVENTGSGECRRMESEPVATRLL